MSREQWGFPETKQDVRDKGNFRIGDTVRGIHAGTFRIKGFRLNGADLLPVHPETLMPGPHPTMFLPLDCIRSMEKGSGFRHPDGLVVIA